MGSIALASPFVSLTDQLNIDSQRIRNLGEVPVSLRYTGAPFSVVGNPTGQGVTLGSPIVPTDAVALEFWSNSISATDWWFFNVRSNGLATDNTGVSANDLISNTGKNNGSVGSSPVRHVVGGTHLIVPFKAVGVLPAAWRMARGSTGINCTCRFISAAANLPYLMAGDEEFIMIGANLVVQFPVGTAAKFPTGYTTCMYQLINGTGTANLARMTTDGTDPGVSLGDIQLAGSYFIDQARHGVAFSALKFYLPSGWFIVGYALIGA